MLTPRYPRKSSPSGRHSQGYLRRWLLGALVAWGSGGWLYPGLAVSPVSLAQAGATSPSALCAAPALARLTRHRVATGDTLDTIAAQYGLLSATVMGFNPSVQGGQVRSGQDLVIPPYNGIRVRVPAGQTWAQVAAAYNRPADLLFEVNGCVSAVPAEIFVPGVNWFPGVGTVATAPPPRQSPLQGYPLPEQAAIVIPYGWQPDPHRNTMVFNTGVALAAVATTPVLAVGAGTVAFAGVDRIYGNLVVVNHADGVQTRYANLAQMSVAVGQPVRPGDRLGQVAPRANQDNTFLFFEVRLNSALGWVAQDPQDFVPTLRIR